VAILNALDEVPCTHRFNDLERFSMESALSSDPEYPWDEVKIPTGKEGYGWAPATDTTQFGAWCSILLEDHVRLGIGKSSPQYSKLSLW
jgi:hypothetical protein